MTLTLYDSYLVSKKEKIRFFVIAGIFGALIGWLFYKNIIVSFAMIFMPLIFFGKYKEYIIGKKKEKMNMEFKDVLYAFSDSAASGRQADSAILLAFRNLERIYGKENLLTMDFKRMAVQVRETNTSPEKLLIEFGENCDIEDIRNFMEIYCICIKAGGDKEKAISKAAGIISEKINLRKELRNVLIQKKLEAVILCAIPPVVLLFMQLTSGDYSAVLYNSVGGRVVMTLCLGAAIWAGMMCLKIMDVKI